MPGPPETNDNSDQESGSSILWQAKVGELEFRAQVRSPGLAAPAWPAPFLSGPSDPDDFAFRVMEEFDRSVSADMKQLFGALVDDVVAGLSQANDDWLDGARQQSAALNQLLAMMKDAAVDPEENEVSADWPDLDMVERTLSETIWLDAGLAFTYALLDDLFDVISGRRLRLLSVDEWAASCFHHLDIERFGRMSGLNEVDVEPLMSGAASAAMQSLHRQLGPKTPQTVLRYRDRWLTVSPVGPDATHLMIEPLRPALIVTSGSDGQALTAFERTDVEQRDGELVVSTHWDVDDRTFTMTFRSARSDPVLRLERGALSVDVEVGELSARSMPLRRQYALANIGLADVLFDRVEFSEARRSAGDGDRWYLAVYSVDDTPGTIAEVASMLGQQRVSIVAAVGKTLGGSGFLIFLVRFESQVSAETARSILMPRASGAKLMLNSVPPPVLRHSVTSPEQGGSLWNISLRGTDRPGLLLTVVSGVESFGGVVWRCSVQVRDSSEFDDHAAPGTIDFECILTVELPIGEQIGQLRESLNALLHRRSEHEKPFKIQTGWTQTILDYWAQAPTNRPADESSNIVVVTGKNQPGLQRIVLQAIYDHHYNIADSASAILGEFWTGIYVINSLTDDDDQQCTILQDALRSGAVQRAHEIFGVEILDGKNVTGASPQETRYDLRFDLPDGLGALAHSLVAFEDSAWNIESLHTHIEERLDVPVGVVRMVVAIPYKPNLGKYIESLAGENGWISYTLDKHRGQGDLYWSGPLMGEPPSLMT